MKYKSTRGGESNVSFEKVLLSAYASDGGLYVPESLPCFTAQQLRSWAPLTFPLVCAEILQIFTDLPITQCRAMTRDAFASFNGGSEAPLPLRRLGDDMPVLLETGEGPTLAFKDIGQQVVAQLLNHYLGARGRHANVLVETSGDTGPAAVEGVRGCHHVDIFCLYPAGRVSPVQELQLITVDAPNVHVYRTEGDTDEQAEMLKTIFMDRDFVERHSICSINSINFARIAAQSSYYVWAYLQLCPDVAEPVDFFVPTGAFGNCMGGYLARRMGLPLGRIVCATNDNDIVHRTLQRGDMSFAENVATVSPAMDIQFAYNLERLLFYMCNENPAELAAYMRALETTRGVQLDELLVRRLGEVFLSVAVSDEDTIATMRDVHERHQYTLCPHSATAVFAAASPRLQAQLRETTTGTQLRAAGAGSRRADRQVCVLTAHPAKFEDAVKRATGSPPAFPPAVQRLKTMPHHFEWLRAPAGGANKQEAWAATLRAAVEESAAQRKARSSGHRARL